MEPPESAKTIDFVEVQNSKLQSNMTKDLESFLKENYNDSIIIVTKQNYQYVRRPFLVVFHHFKMKSEELKKWTDELYELTLKFPNTIQFAVMDFKDAQLFHMDWNNLQHFGFNINRSPYVFAVDEEERQHDFDGAFTTNELIRFCEHLEKNQLYHSEPISTKESPYQNVQEIVADNFRQLVEHSDKDVIVTLHSKYSFLYDFTLYGIPSDLKDDSDKLVFYAINADINYVPLEYRVRNLPTSFFIPQNDKNKRLRYVHSYNDSKDMLQFIAKNTTSSLKTVDRNGCYKDPEKNNLKSPLENLYDILAMFERMPKKNTSDEYFFKFLDSILKKVNEKERFRIEMELITVVLAKINKVTKS